MALPLKNGVDLYTNELLRARLHNFDGDLAEHGVGSIYFNTTEKLNTSDRVRYRGKTAWHSVANLEDIEDVKDLIKALSGSSSESVASVLGRVITLEGYFSNGKAKDADLLDGHNSDYFAEAATLNDLLEDYEAFKAVFSDNSDDYINTWTEVKAFLDGIKNTEDLNAILLGINTELGKKADKATTLAGYGIKDGMKVMPWIASEGVDFNNLTTVGSYGIASHNAHNGPICYGTLLTMGGDYNYYRSQLAIYENGQMYVRAKNGNDIWSDWRTVLDNYNYASELDKRYLQLTGGTINGDLAISSGLWANQLTLNSTGSTVGIRFNTKGENEGILLVDTGTKQLCWFDGNQNVVLHKGNYSDLITTLNGNLSVGGNLTVSGNSINLGNADSITAVAGTFSVNKSATFKENVFFTSAEGIYINRTSINWGKEFDFVSPLINFAADQITVKQKATIEGDLYVTGHIIADGQVSSGGIGSEGSGSGASGIVILEDWEKYDDTLAQVLGAGLGVGLRDKIAALESKATNVSVAQTLTSGKEIGAITIDGVATKLFAPNDYLPLSGGTLNGSLGMTSAEIPDGAVGLWGTGSLYLKASDKVSFYNSSTGAFNEILHSGNYESIVGDKFLKLSGGTVNGLLTVKRDAAVPFYVINEGNFQSSWVALRFGIGSTYKSSIGASTSKNGLVRLNSDLTQEYEILDEGNYASVLDNAYLKLSGGTLTDSVMVNHSSGSKGYLLLTNGASIGGLVTNGTAVELFNVNGYGIGVEGTSDVYVLTNWSKKTLLHAGNFNSYAPTLTGTGASGTWGIDISGYAFGIATSGNYNASGLTETKADQIVYCNTIAGSTEGLFPALGNYANAVLTINRHPDILSGSQLGFSNNGNLYYRNAIDTTTAWKQLAFTDSNVASATKLATQRSFWGNLFDGTGDVTGGIAFNSVQKISWHNNADSYYIRSSVFTGATNPSLEFCAWGGHFFSSQGVTRLIINQAGNVTIGGNDYAGENCKLFVDGVVNVGSYGSLHRDSNSHMWVNYGGSEAEKNLILCGYNTSFYYGKGSNYQSAMSINSSGNVGIGTTSPTQKLDVRGNQYITGYIYADGALHTGQWLKTSTGVAFGSAHTLTYNSYAIISNAELSFTNITTVDISTGIKAAIKAGLMQINDIIGHRIILGSNSAGIASNQPFSICTYSGVSNYAPAKVTELFRVDPAGEVTIKKDLIVEGNVIAYGQVSAGGVAEEGAGAVGGSGLERVVFTIPAQTTSFTCEHNLGTREISVAIYEEGNDYQQVLTDVYLDSTNVARIVFGAATDVAHKVVIIG